MNNKGWEAESNRREIKSRRGPRGIAGSNLGIFLMVALAAGNDRARCQITGEAREECHLTVMVYTYAPIPQHDLATAERVAGKILQSAGVELSWVDCPLTGQTAQLNPVCTAPHTPTDIHLNIAPDLAKDPWVGKFGMGFAVVTPPPNRGQLVFISYARARRVLLEAHELTLGELLGHGIAHEIGHLLLGTTSHSPSGLMCADWKTQELKLAARSQLRFSADQAVTIRRDVRARRAQQEAAESHHVAFQK